MKEAYYWLGRTAHLLEDMAVPAHVHLDQHVLDTENAEWYSQYASPSSTPPYVFGDFGAWSTGTSIPDWETLPYYQNPDDSGLVRLFYNLARDTSEFDTDDMGGDEDENDCNQFRYKLEWDFKDADGIDRGFDRVSKILFYDFTWGGHTDGLTPVELNPGSANCKSGDYEYDIGNREVWGSEITKPSIYLYEDFAVPFDEHQWWNPYYDVLIVEYYGADRTTLRRSGPVIDLDQRVAGAYSIVPSSVIRRNYDAGHQLPKAIGHVAALYRLFWQEVQGPPPCYGDTVSLSIGAAPTADSICHGYYQRYSFHITGGRDYRVTVAPSVGDPNLYLDLMGNVSNEDYQYLSENSGSEVDSWRFTATFSGTYNAAVYGNSSGTTNYTIRVQDVTSVPAVGLTAAPSIIEIGDSSVLSWTATGATSCTASGNGWTGSRPTSGTEVVSPTATRSYTLTCTGPGGSDTDGVTVALVAHDHSLAITTGATGSPDPVAPGGMVALGVVAEDSLGHPLGYAWYASCPGLSSSGSFNNPTLRTPVWTAPGNATGSQQECAIKVVVGDPYGLSQQSSYSQGVTSTNHTITVTTPAIGSPNPVISGTFADWTVGATDSLGHELSYSWEALCPGLPSNGDIIGTMSQTPRWRAPENETGATQSCTVQVTVSDGHGLSQQSSYDHGVLPGGAAALSVSDGVRLLEPPPYQGGQRPTLEARIENIGGSAVAIDYFKAMGEFTRPDGGPVILGDWPAQTFEPPLVFNPGDEYHYISLMADSLPAGASVGRVMMYAKFDEVTSLDAITNAESGAVPQIEFVVGHVVEITNEPGQGATPVASGGEVSISMNAWDSFYHPVVAHVR